MGSRAAGAVHQAPRRVPVPTATGDTKARSLQTVEFQKRKPSKRSNSTQGRAEVQTSKVGPRDERHERPSSRSSTRPHTAPPLLPQNPIHRQHQVLATSFDDFLPRAKSLPVQRPRTGFRRPPRHGSWSPQDAPENPIVKWFAQRLDKMDRNRNEKQMRKITIGS